MINDSLWLQKALEEYHELYNELPRWYRAETGAFFMQLLGCEIVLGKNGYWCMNDTSGG